MHTGTYPISALNQIQSGVYFNVYLQSLTTSYGLTE